MPAACRLRALRAGGWILVALGLLALAAAAQAEDQLEGFAAPEEQPVRTELIAENASIQPGGTTRIGVHFEIEPGWHIYTKDPGDAGLPTQITWSVPPTASVSELHWPLPQQFLDPGDIRTSVYSGTVVLYSSLTYRGPAPPARATEEKPLVVPLRASVKWLACKEICIPGSADLALTLPASATPPVFSTHAQLFEQVEVPGTF